LSLYFLKLLLGRAETCDQLGLFVAEQRVAGRRSTFRILAWLPLLLLLFSYEMGAIRPKQRQRLWIAVDRGIA